MSGVTNVGTVGWALHSSNASIDICDPDFKGEACMKLVIDTRKECKKRA